jgi:hypothetical protein
LAAGLIGLNCHVSRAQPIGIAKHSIEWMTTDCDLVVRATIDKVDPVYKDSYSINRVITLRVLETYKGDPIDSLRFMHRGDFGRSHIETWREKQCEILFFLKDWRFGFSRWATGYVLSGLPNYAARNAIELTAGKVEEYSMNLELIRSSDDLIAAVKKFLTEPHYQKQQRISHHMISLPPSFYQAGIIRFDLTVPLDVELERLAKGWIDTKEFHEIGLKAQQPFQPRLVFAEFKQKFAAENNEFTVRQYSRRNTGYVGVDSLELMATDCDLVVLGTISDFCYAMKNPDHGQIAGVEFHVKQTLKGESKETISFAVGNPEDLAYLKKNNAPLLVFLKRNRLRLGMETYGMLEYSARAMWDDAVVVLFKDFAEVLSSDLTWVKTPEQILLRLRKFLAETSFELPTPTFDFHPPESIVRDVTISGNRYAIVHLPVNSQLEANAKKWLVSKDKNIRWIGARAIVYFKSDENADLLRPLLTDDDLWERSERFRMIGSLANVSLVIRRLTRWEAWNVLHGWGYKVNKPKFQ